MSRSPLALFIHASVLMAAAPAPAPAQVADATTIALSAPATVATLEPRRFKGEPTRMAWSPDAREIYIQMVEMDRRGVPAKLSHVRISLPDGRVGTMSAEPAWAAKYWGWKSGQASPVAAGFRIAVDSKEEVVRPTGVAMGGDLARGGTEGGGGGMGAGAGVSVDEITSATNQAQKVVTWTLRLKGEVIGTWVNQAVVPGLTFGWAPKVPIVAFCDKGGALVLMDEATHKKTVEGVDDARLPAWSDDGSRLAVLSGSERRGWTLVTVDVGRP